MLQIISIASVLAHGRLRMFSYTRETSTTASYLLNPDQKIKDNFVTKDAALCWCPHIPDTLASSARHPAFMLKISEHLADTPLNAVTIWDLSKTESPVHHTLYCPHPVKHLQFNSNFPDQLAMTDFEGRPSVRDTTSGSTLSYQVIFVSSIGNSQWSRHYAIH